MRHEDEQQAAYARSADRVIRAASRGTETRRAPGFANEPLEDMVAVSAVTADTARLWIRNERGGRVRLDYWPCDAAGAVRSQSVEALEAGTDRTVVAGLPPLGAEPLRPGCRYAYRATHVASGGLLGEGGFETAPADAAAAPERFAIAFMSCHQPFDDNGQLVAVGTGMLRAARRCLEDHSVKRVLMIGDQMYTDYPPSLSVFDADYFRSISPDARYEHVTQCSAEELREILHARYRHFWNVDGWRHLHANYACYPIIDDHELVDNWGSVAAHSSREWRAFGAGARAAYADYQGSRVTDDASAREDFDYGLEYGPLATYVMDLRSNRRAGDDARIYSDAQLERLRGFLARHADKQFVQIVFSVPAVHLPKWGARLGKALSAVPNEDFSDRWSTAGHVRDRDRMLRLLHDHQRANPGQRILLLSGDIHIACAHRIVWDDGTRPLIQLVSSGITNRVGGLIQTASKLSILANRRLTLHGDGLGARVRLLPGRGRKRINPYTRLNLGIVEFARGGDGRYAARYLIYGHRRDAPVCAYRSAWL